MSRASQSHDILFSPAQNRQIKPYDFAYVSCICESNCDYSVKLNNSQAFLQNIFKKLLKRQNFLIFLSQASKKRPVSVRKQDESGLKDRLS